MKKTIKLIAILVLLTIGFTSCHKTEENNGNNLSNSHKVRYEVISLGEEEANIELNYSTQNGIGCCNGVTTEKEIATTPWQHEFTIYESFPFVIDVDIENYFNNPIPAKTLLYIDDQLVAEQQNNNHSYILLQYFYTDYD